MESVATVIAHLRSLRGTAASHGDHELAEAIAALTALRAASDAVWMEHLAEAERRRLGRRQGARDTATWVAELAGERPGAARREVELATAIESAPIVNDAVQRGELSLAKAALLTETTELPADAQRDLVEQAKTAPVSEVAGAVRRSQLLHGRREEPEPPRCRISRSPRRVRIDADLDLVDGEIVETALDALASTLGMPPTTPYIERRGAALVAMSKRYLDHADHVPNARHGAAHVVVVIDADVLDGTRAGGGRLQSGAVVSAQQVRQLADDGSITRVVMRGPSEVLDVGRATRTVSAAMAKAVIARDQHCRWVGCAAPPWACDVHHRVPWTRGGPTAITNLGLLCWHHHRHVHAHGAHLVVERPDGRWTLEPPD